MKCNRIQTKISAYVDEELDSRWQARVHDHLQSCQSCSAIFYSFEQVDALLQDDSRLKCGAFMLTRIKAGIGVTSRRSMHSSWSFLQKVLAPTTILAGFLLGILLGLQLYGSLLPNPDSGQQSYYSTIDSNIFEPLPSGSITATYVSLDNLR